MTERTAQLPQRLGALLSVSLAFFSMELLGLYIVGAWTTVSLPWNTRISHSQNSRATPSFSLDAKAGSFFNPVPQPSENNDTNSNSNGDDSKPSKAIQPSTINGIPSEQVGIELGMSISATIRKDSFSSKPYVGIGPPSLNDVTKPEYDDQGYTLYADEKTGTKARVFEALVEYPCLFTLKIVGANEDNFVKDVLTIVATTCRMEESSYTSLDHSIKYNGKWASITVQAPVESAQMLYQLYEDVDRDPRVKFKF
jgi:putative lipoic acid-binding regulatory protein